MTDEPDDSWYIISCEFCGRVDTASDMFSWDLDDQHPSIKWIDEKRLVAACPACGSPNTLTMGY